MTETLTYIAVHTSGYDTLADLQLLVGTDREQLEQLAGQLGGRNGKHAPVHAGRASYLAKSHPAALYGLADILHGLASDFAEHSTRLGLTDPDEPAVDARYVRPRLDHCAALCVRAMTRS